MVRRDFLCPKCDCRMSDKEDVRFAGKFSRFFDIQSKRFIAESCAACGYTEFYREKSSRLGNAADFLLGG